MPTQEAIQKLVAARLAADVTGVPTPAGCSYRCRCGGSDYPIATHMTANLLLASVPVKASSVLMRVLSKRSAVAWRMRHMLTWYGVKPPRRIWNWRVALHKPSTRNIRANCWLITARRRSTGRKPRRQNYCQLPAAAVGYGLQVPVHHPGRYPQHVVQHV